MEVICSLGMGRPIWEDSWDIERDFNQTNKHKPLLKLGLWSLDEFVTYRTCPLPCPFLVSRCRVEE